MFANDWHLYFRIHHMTLISDNLCAFVAIINCVKVSGNGNLFVSNDV